MNVVVKQLATKQTLQDFLMRLLDDVEKYFRAAGPMSEEKAIASLGTIFARVQREFPLITSVVNLNKRIAKDLREKIADRTDKARQKRKATHLKSFMEGIEVEEEGFNRVSSQENQQNIQAWIKKMLVQTIGEIKDEVRQADHQASETLAAKLSRIASPDSQLPEILFADSLLTNQAAVNALQGYTVKKIVTEPKAVNQISFQEGAKGLRKARLLILSADAILRNGGLLCASGSLMLAVAARELGVPVVAVSRSYCLWQHIICNQQLLVLSENGRSWFPSEDEFSFRVVVGKRFDYVSPDLIVALVGESKGWQNKSIVQIFQEYYH